MSKLPIQILFVLLITFSISNAQSVTFNEASGWMETAFATWQPVSGADSYNVYYSGQGYTNEPVDDQLIRSYGTYYRVDIPGLQAGTYTITVAPVTSGTEGTSATTSSITVTAHDRTGFSFNNSRIPGAYNLDGTPMSGAVILYITENTKDVISLNVTGANSNPCVGLQEILEGFKKGDDNRPLIVRFIGQITDFSYMSNGDIVVENDKNASSHITLEGIGDDATADGWGIRIKNATNIEIRNIGLMNCNSGEGDNIGLQQNNDYIWVHNCDFFYGDAGGDSDQAKGDGALDCKKSTYVTFSYNHFWDSGKANLLGLSEGTTTGLYITYHHNWYDHSDSRHPRVRFYSAHIYNNYYDGNAKYGAGSTKGSSLFVESNYFRNCKFPMLTSMQGSDIYDDSTQANDTDNATFSSEDGGSIKAANNYMIGEHRFVAYGDTNYTNSTVDFDAYVVTNPTDNMPSSVTSSYGGNSHNNFNTSSVMYTYTAQTPANARTTVMQYAGRMDGGDFTWTFNNSVDDTDSDVNTALKSALLNYQTSLVGVQGDGGVVVNPGGDYTLTVTVSGSGTVSGGGTYDDGTTATLTATPASGWSFSNWSGDASGTSTTTTVYMDDDKAVTAVFTQDGGGGTGGDEIHNFTESGTSSSFYTISGSLSTSKGTVYYGGLTLTQCMKIESSTSVNFTASQEGTLTLVFNDTFTGNFKIDGTNYAAASGIITTTVSSGSHTLTKGDVANLYYMSLEYAGTTTTTYNLTTAVTGQGSVSPSSGTYDEGTSVSLTATPNTGWQFDGWSGGYTGNPTTITMDADKSITATFSEIPTTSTTITIQENASGFCSVDGSVDNNNSGYTGTGFANTDNASGNSISYSVTASGGSATLVIGYANGGGTDRPANIVVNNATAVSSLSFPATTNWTTWSTVSTTVTLTSGTNDIVLEATSSGGLGNIDYLEITGNGVSAASCSSARQMNSGGKELLSKNTLDSTIKLYPNPARTTIAILSSISIERVVLYNVTGQQVLVVTEAFSNISLNALQKGHYFVKVFTEEGTSTHQLVKF
ncbi:hypothetical protein NBRC110019_25170 [Neptunitalea chrysea]|uniref:CBM6 domain-containing protein n=1 Tax=Neptunitalea chrysea TaxID=1647581 RepID=A0A9W6B610_9FLAO|nr:T9SS type A sorting domain-containing protein [Neptunitalea chrysea]GLB53476.1 hypothetical protein NBRC110019_25170 [Neptunitalea chrysea]